MKTRVPLSENLRRAAQVLEAEQPPADLRARIHGRLRAVPLVPVGPSASAAGRPLARWPWAWSGAAGCAAVVLVSVLLMLRPPASTRPGIDGLPSAFVPLAPPEHWPAGTAAAWLVRTELRGDRLAAMGLPFDPAHAGDSVRAELLVHPSGELLAVRFMP